MLHHILLCSFTTMTSLDDLIYTQLTSSESEMIFWMICVCVCMCIHICLCMYMCVYVCMCTRVCIIAYVCMLCVHTCDHVTMWPCDHVTMSIVYIICFLGRNKSLNLFHENICSLFMLRDFIWICMNEWVNEWMIDYPYSHTHV